MILILLLHNFYWKKKYSRYLLEAAGIIWIMTGSIILMKRYCPIVYTVIIQKNEFTMMNQLIIYSTGLKHLLHGFLITRLMKIIRYRERETHGMFVLLVLVQQYTRIMLTQYLLRHKMEQIR